MENLVLAKICSIHKSNTISAYIANRKGEFHSRNQYRVVIHAFVQFTCDRKLQYLKRDL